MVLPVSLGSRAARRNRAFQSAGLGAAPALGRESLRQQRLSAVLIGGFAVGALLLAAVGLFGVVSGSVTRRRHELAVRLAEGTDHRRVLRLVVSEGALLIALVCLRVDRLVAR